MEKRQHGTAVPMWERLGLEQFSPVDCGYKVGDAVIYTNDYGVSFDMKVIGFSKQVTTFGGVVHLIGLEKETENGDAWWYPNRIDQITKKEN